MWNGIVAKHRDFQKLHIAYILAKKLQGLVNGRLLIHVLSVYKPLVFRQKYLIIKTIEETKLQRKYLKNKFATDKLMSFKTFGF